MDTTKLNFIKWKCYALFNLFTWLWCQRYFIDVWTYQHTVTAVFIFKYISSQLVHYGVSPVNRKHGDTIIDSSNFLQESTFYFKQYYKLVDVCCQCNVMFGRVANSWLWEASDSAVFTARAGRVCLLHWRRFWLFTALFGTLPSENISIFPLGVNNKVKITEEFSSSSF